MSLSKIYRGSEAEGLQQFQFRSFGDPEPDERPLAEFKSTDPTLAPGAVVTPPPVASGPTQRDVEEAYANGRREGMEQADERLVTATAALTAALEEVSRIRDSLASSGTEDMLRLVMAVSEQVIRREVAADPDVIFAIIENALKSSVQADQYRVRVNPEDLEKVSEKKPLFLASISGLKNLTIEADSSLSPGGCLIDSDLGEVDATLETQLETIRQALKTAITER